MSTIPDNESFGDYSASNSNVWIGPSPIQRGHISTSTFRSAGDDIYANRWVNQRKNESTSTSTFTGSFTAPTVNLSSIEYSDSTGFYKLIVKERNKF